MFDVDTINQINAEEEAITKEGAYDIHWSDLLKVDDGMKEFVFEDILAGKTIYPGYTVLDSARNYLDDIVEAGYPYDTTDMETALVRERDFHLALNGKLI